MGTAGQPRRLLALVAVLAAVGLPAAGAAGPDVSPRLGLVSTRDVLGLRSAPVPAATRRAWTALLPASARAGAAVSVLRGPQTLLASRVARGNASLKRTLARVPAARL